MNRPFVLSALLFALPCVAQTPTGTPPKPAPVVEEKPKVEPKPVTQEPKPATGTTTTTGGATGGAGGKTQDPAKTETPKPDQQKTEPPKPDEGKGEKPPVDPIPASADPADLRAIRGAQQMLEAEKKIADLIKAGKITGLDKILPFDELTSWQYEDGLKGMPQRVKDLSGKKVLMTGFMLPIDEVQNIKEFLLVQSLWACCYGQPPDIHGFVRVVMPKGKTTDYFFDPLKVVGKFRVEATVMEGYCVDIYQLECESIEVIK